MKKSALIVVAALLIAGVGAVPGAVAADDGAAPTPDCEFPVTVEDATGETVTLDEPPERVVTTGPSAAQTMWEIGAEDRVVGLTAHATYLEGADDREIVSDNEGYIDVEKVVAAEPDLVLAPNAVGEDTVSQLREAGITVYLFGFASSLDDVVDHTARTGELVDACDGTESTLAWMTDEIDAVETAVEGEDRPTVLYTFFGFTAGSGTHVDDIIRTAGGENAAAEAGIEGYEQINEEVVVDADPDWILLNTDDPALPDSPAFNETTAVQEDRVITVEIEHINQPAPWNVHALVTIVEHLHPEAYAAATDAGDGADSTDASDGSDDGTTDDAGPLPGFGAAAALIAIVGTLTIRRVGG